MAAVVQTLDEVGLLKQEVALLRTQIAWLKQQLFGPGKSEKLDRAQLLMPLGALGQLAALPPPVETITYERTKPPGEPRPRPVEHFAHLPVQETIELVPEEVQRAPEAYERIGEERTFEVDVTPPKLFKREIVRPKYRHRREPDRAPVLALAPARAVAGGYAAAGLLAWIVLGKYVDHLPLYRLERLSARWGATLSRQTMADWIALTAQWLEPIYRLMYRELLQGGYIQADETPVHCNDPDEKRGGTTQGWLWAISRPGGDVVFDWRLTRRHGELTSLLDGYRGILQSDGYEAYPNFARTHEGVVWVGCWAHARRKFFEAMAEQPKAVQLVLRLIGRLYQLERQWDATNVSDQRAVLRQEHFARPLRWLRLVALKLRSQVLPRSLLGNACSYLLAHWAPLSEHLHHARTRLDNNLVENAIRPSAIPTPVNAPQSFTRWSFPANATAKTRSHICAISSSAGPR
jgi:transposase